MLSMLIAEYALHGRNTSSDIRQPDKMLRGIRLSQSTEDDLYLHISRDGDDVTCRSGPNVIRVKDTEASTVAETILSFCEILTEWEEDLRTMISRNCTLKNLVDRSVPVMGNPMFIIDESNVIRAISDHGPGEINSDWDYIIENGCVSLEIIQNVFSAPPFRKNAVTEPSKPFYFRPKDVISGAINFRIPANSGKGFVGSLIILEGLTAIKPVMLQYVTILTDALLLWFRLNGGAQPMDSAKEVLRELLVTGQLGEVGENMLKGMVGGHHDQYVMICAAGQKDANLEPYLMNLEEIIPRGVCCLYRENIVILSDAFNGDRNARLIEQLIWGEKPSIGVSNNFTGLRQAGSFLVQALTAMEYGGKGISKIDAEIIMRYIAHQAYKSSQGISIIHPALSILQSYDAKHGGDYYKTLYVFLTMERSIAAALPVLNIHRNTMIFRLERITALVGTDLESHAVREWLLFSYRICGIPG